MIADLENEASADAHSRILLAGNAAICSCGGEFESFARRRARLRRDGDNRSWHGSTPV